MQRLERIPPEQRVGCERVDSEAGDADRTASGVGRSAPARTRAAVTGTSPRLPSASTSRPGGAGARDHGLERQRAGEAEPLEARELGLGGDARRGGGVDQGQRVGEHRGGGLERGRRSSGAPSSGAVNDGARALGARARQRLRQRELAPPTVRARLFGQRRAGSGSIPRTICDSRASTAAARRSPKVAGPGADDESTAPDTDHDGAGYLTAFLRPDPAVKRGTRLAAIVIVSPVRGLRPSRAPRSATWNLPKPGEADFLARLRVRPRWC